MLSTDYDLSNEYSVTLDASGEGWIRSIGPAQYGEEWQIDSTQTQSDSAAQTKLSIFRNGTTQLVEGSYSGNLDTSNTTFKLKSGETLTYKYEEGTPGAIARIQLTGKRIVRGRRAY